MILGECFIVVTGSCHQVVLSCVSPKYVVSHHCNRELSLADLLAKPIIPVMFDPVPWPPPGGMSLIFSQLVYIDMKGKHSSKDCIIPVPCAQFFRDAAFEKYFSHMG